MELREKSVSPRGEELAGSEHSQQQSSGRGLSPGSIGVAEGGVGTLMGTDGADSTSPAP